MSDQHIQAQIDRAREILDTTQDALDNLIILATNLREDDILVIQASEEEFQRATKYPGAQIVSDGRGGEFIVCNYTDIKHHWLADLFKQQEARECPK